MNVVREINKINERELELGTSNASWHDEYKDSAYIFVGGLNYDLTEGDVITIFSQYGEIMDVNLPRDKETGKTKGFGFVMYEDQRSTVLAVDNLNGAKVLDRTLRVDHVRDYKQPKVKDETGEMVEREEQSLNAKPELIYDDASSESSASSGPEIDPEDPMAAYLLEQKRERKAAKKAKKAKHRSKREDETPEERRARKERKKEKRRRKMTQKSDGLRGVEELLKSIGGTSQRRRSASPSHQDRSRSPRATRQQQQRRDDEKQGDHWRHIGEGEHSKYGSDRTSGRRHSPERKHSSRHMERDRQ